MSEAPTLTPKASPQHAANGGTPSQSSSVPEKHQSPPEPNLFSRIADALGLASSQPDQSDAVASSSQATPQEQNPKHDANVLDDNDGVVSSTTVPVAGPGIGQSMQLPPPQPRAQQEPPNKSGTTKDVDVTLAPKSGQDSSSRARRSRESDLNDPQSYVGQRVCTAQGSISEDIILITGFIISYDEQERLWEVKFEDTEDSIEVDKNTLGYLLALQQTKEQVAEDPAKPSLGGASRSRRSTEHKRKKKKKSKHEKRARKAAKEGSEDNAEEEKEGEEEEEEEAIANKRPVGRPRKDVGTPTTPKASETASGATPPSAKDSAKKSKKVSKLAGGRADVGMMVAKDFPPQGVFTGTVLSVAKGKSPLWKIRYEDGDEEELSESEMEEALVLYETLAARSEDAVGSQVKVDNDDANSEGDSDEEIEGASGKRKKGKGRGRPPKKTKTNAAGGKGLVGTHVRKKFPQGEFDGKVVKYRPEAKGEPALWHVKYEDGDEEDLAEAEVEKGQKMHDLFYELQKKEVEFSSKEMKDLKLSGTSRTFTTYSEKPPGSRIYTTLEGYRTKDD